LAAVARAWARLSAAAGQAAGREAEAGAYTRHRAPGRTEAADGSATGWEAQAIEAG
jgi:hypothetical protein